jgi:hypothetical protein
MGTEIELSVPAENSEDGIESCRTRIPAPPTAVTLVASIAEARSGAWWKVMLC